MCEDSSFSGKHATPCGRERRTRKKKTWLKTFAIHTYTFTASSLAAYTNTCVGVKDVRRARVNGPKDLVRLKNMNKLECVTGKA